MPIARAAAKNRTVRMGFSSYTPDPRGPRRAEGRVVFRSEFRPLRQSGIPSSKKPTASRFRAAPGVHTVMLKRTQEEPAGSQVQASKGPQVLSHTQRPNDSLNHALMTTML